AGLDDLANPIVERVADVQVACGVDIDADWIVESRHRRDTAVAAEAADAVAGDGADDAVGQHLAGAIVAGIGDEEVTPAIGRENALAGEVDRGWGRKPAVASEAAEAAARDGADDAVGHHLANTTVAAVEDEDVAPRIDCDVRGLVELGVDRQSAIAA